MPSYIDIPIEVDPDTLAQVAYESLQANIPGWSPAPGNLETRLIEAVARVAAVIGTLASTAPTSIFRYLGPLVGVIPVDAYSASAATTWTMRDNAGYTIPAGTQVVIRAAGDVPVAFLVVADVIVPPGSTVTATGGVAIVANVAGAASSGLGTVGGTVELVDLLDYVTGVVQTAATTGGADAEDDAVYLDRLRTEFQMLTPRPILPADVAALAENVAGVDRAVAIDGYNPDANEIETVTVNATGGTFTLTFEGQTTTAIAWNAAAATVQTALEALSNIAPGDVAVTGGPLATAALTVEFRGAYAGTNVTQMTANSASLTGGTHTATAATTRQGSPTNGNPRMVAIAAIDTTGNAVGSTIQAALAAALEAQRETNFVFNVIAPTYTTIDVSYTVTVVAGFDSADVLARTEAAVTSFLSPADWGIPQTGNPRAWLLETTVRYTDLAWALRNVQGVNHVTALSFCVTGGSLATTDVALTGVAPLPLAGTITGATA